MKKTLFSRALLYSAVAMLFLLSPVSEPLYAAKVKIDAVTRNYSQGPDPLELTRDGVATMPVVISSTADDETRARAEELIAYLQKITGAEFALREDFTGVGIYVGTLEEFPTPSAVEGLKHSNQFDGREAFAIRTENGSVRLLGTNPMGVSHAVYRFLELVGCRWFFQGPAWEVIPSQPTLMFNANVTDRPEVLTRMFGYPMGQHFEKDDPDAGKEIQSWYRRNRVASSFGRNAAHTAHNIRWRFQEEFDQHPEYNAMVDGVRNTGKWGQLCVTNPRVVELAIEYTREYFDKNPKAEMASVGPDDGFGYCTCEPCAKLGKPTNQSFLLANRVAVAIQESHPGKLVGLLAYSWHCDPPDFPLEPNIYVELTTALLLHTEYSFEELLEMWPKKAAYFGIYDYWAVYDWIRDRFPSGRTGDMTYVAKQIPHLVKSGPVAIVSESGNSWGSQGLGYYLASRLMWNSSLDVEALKTDFYEKAFGPSASIMRQYYEYTDLGEKPFVGRSFYRQCMEYLEDASKAAATHPEVQTRIEHLKQYHVFVYLLSKHEKAMASKVATEEEKKQTALELMRWSYLIRNTYQTFWGFFVDQTTKRLSREFNEPNWNYYVMFREREQDSIPYRDLEGKASDETAGYFEKMKADYGDVPPKFATVEYSNRLVLPDWQNILEGTARKGYQPTQGYIWQSQVPPIALVSHTGEPLRFQLNQGIIYKDMSAGNYIITDLEGREVAKDRLRTGAHDLEIPVPAPGTYFLKYQDNNGGASIVPHEGVAAAFVLEKGEGFKVSNHCSFFFYVPKGTEEILLYADKSGAPFGICQPDGHWVGSDAEDAEAKDKKSYLMADGSYLRIPVPPFMDGEIWTAHLLNRGRFHFFNIPNVVSFHSDGVLIPEELAKRDGLLK